LRELSAGIKDSFNPVVWVLPLIFAREAMALLGGTPTDYGTNSPIKDFQGNYLTDGGRSSGMLYVGEKAIKKFSDEYELEFGEAPRMKYRWIHITPINRAFEPHLHLQGKIVTRDNEQNLLLNVKDSWLPLFYYPGDHKNCRCLLLPFI
jgi:hypothetical protein